jgi:hypothetical protein
MPAGYKELGSHSHLAEGPQLALLIVSQIAQALKINITYCSQTHKQGIKKPFDRLLGQKDATQMTIIYVN